MENAVRCASRPHRPASARFLVCAAALFSIMLDGAVFAADVTIDEIKAQWKAQEERCASFRIDWNESIFYPKGSSSRDFGTPPEPPYPPKDTVIDFKRSILFERERIRIVDQGRYTSGDHLFLPAVRTLVWNGAEARTLIDFESTDLESVLDVGFIEKERMRAYADAQFRPPLIACWPLTAGSGIALEGYRVSRSEFNGKETLLLKKPRVDGPDAQLWLQAQPPYLVVRSVGYLGNRPHREIEIEYSVDSEQRFYPARWKMMTRNGEGSIREANATSHDFSPDVIDGDFTIEYPTGAWVHDNTDPNKPRQFLQRQDGSRRYILEEELRRRATYKDLWETETGQARLPGSEQRSSSK